jgi:hypothetical protein
MIAIRPTSLVTLSAVLHRFLDAQKGCASRTSETPFPHSRFTLGVAFSATAKLAIELEDALDIAERTAV